MRNICQDTPLIIACYNNSIDVVKFLITLDGIDINAQDYYGNTPLHEACRCNYRDIVEILIGFRGININIRNVQGDIPINMTRDKRINNLLTAPEKSVEDRKIKEVKN
ncbi:ankyrin repeat protein, putative [Trichomonas vaginalis G3]|uniref:Ankyrin repeat protein, putative n=1 Tax=Trichomonas vaginalis (strain ATCC PRA-98 / G3) TaxID=412133 RepID=A2ED03_TRIV3|nr:ankyrin repeat domain-containing protein 49 family [Trichomonas vaginalis G3]EAY09454.1 ankyrin repeat protein, putative [Trichomonas vaginalis G3]KAI5500651.1 ankyrin repeat domain-containing protein 49 family [Trichomonas vaginalis G3]|eukprot:XP_001321677.1 ankyrin repeat protein [Trichomonas vaginalis G3]